MDMVTVRNLSKSYGDFTAVKGISFSIGRGEIFGFLGPNGAGKTTTINMMIGLARPSGGSITINGIDVVKNVKKAQAIMGVVPDESNLYDEMDGFNNLCFCASLYGMRKAEREKRAQELLELFDLTKAGKRPFKAYSKGMRRKLTIAAAVIHKPDILFLDEPTTGIDLESARQIRQLLLDLKQDGTTVFITTHYLEEAERVCDRIAFIVDGNIVAQGTVAELREGIFSNHAVRLNTDTNLEPLAPELQTYFSDLTVKVSVNTLTLISDKRFALLPVLEYLDGKGVSVYEAKELRPTLEDIFLKVAGIEAGKAEGGLEK
ncbi:MAG: ABC transporter ATP-binding protein [Firmicutes bacterium]|nr:ABC transporter ATP-binding protein [Bacillota bacterium]